MLALLAWELLEAEQWASSRQDGRGPVCPGQKLSPGSVTAWPCGRRRGGQGIMVGVWGVLLWDLGLPGSLERPPSWDRLAPARLPED